MFKWLEDAFHVSKFGIHYPIIIRREMLKWKGTIYNASRKRERGGRREREREGKRRKNTVPVFSASIISDSMFS